MPKPKPTVKAQDLQTIDPTALTTVSGGARSGRTPDSGAGSGGGSGAGGGAGGGTDAVIGALTGILDSLSSLSHQGSRGVSPPEMMMLIMMMQQRNSGVQVVQQPALPVIYTNGTNRSF